MFYCYHHRRSPHLLSNCCVLVLPPPALPAFTRGYANVALLLNCDAMHYVMNLVLARGLAKRSKSWSETQYEKVGLISLILQSVACYVLER